MITRHRHENVIYRQAAELISPAEPNYFHSISENKIIDDVTPFPSYLYRRKMCRIYW